MNSINFPQMFSGNSTIINNETNDNKNVLQALHLLLSSENGSLFGDPYFGIRLRKYFFEQNNYILRDILVDEIYTQIITFLPQIYLERKNIVINQQGSKLYVTISFKNRKNFQNNTYNLVLFDSEENK